jgi:hypothetical protein
MILRLRRARGLVALCAIPSGLVWAGLVAASVLLHSSSDALVGAASAGESSRPHLHQLSYLVIPPVAALLLVRPVGRVFAIAQALGVAASFLGLYLSYRLDLPTGTTVVATLGGLLVVCALASRMIGREA